MIPRISQETDEGVTTVTLTWDRPDRRGVIVAFSAGDDEAIWSWGDPDHHYSSNAKTFSLREGLPPECVAMIEKIN